MQGRRVLDIIFSKQMLKKDYKELKSTLKIAKKYGVSKKCILNYMDQFGISRQRDLIPIDKVRALAAKHMSAPEIAKELGFTPTGISKIARENNIPIIDKFHKGYIITHNSYVMVRLIKEINHPAADSKGYVRLHRLIMENHLGRTLEPDELVHHINGNKLDNRVENLELITKASHVSLHHTGKKGRDPAKPQAKNKI